MNKCVISIANDFSKTPAGRYETDGPYSGQRFRNELLIPTLQDCDKVTINLDGTIGYGSSFLEEAFAGVVRLNIFSKKELLKKLTIISSRELYKETIINYIREA